MKTLSIDIETYSDVQLPKTGVYRYCESPNFEILLFAYSIDSQPVQVIDLACGETIPVEILDALEDDTVIKWAFNAAFERICLSRFLGYNIKQLSIWLSVKLVKHNAVNIKPVFGIGLSREYLIEAVGRLVNNTLLGSQYFHSFIQRRTHTHHICSNIKNNRCLLAVSGASVYFCTFFAITASKQKSDSGGKF
jgi:hypothetical protein